METETPIGHGFGGFPLFKVAKRKYRCRDCGNEVLIETNHRVDCYPTCKGKCRQFIRTGRGSNEQEIVLPKQTVHEYLGDC